MGYIVMWGIQCEEFDTYREAEIYCGECDIPCEEIYEKEEEA